MPDVNIPLSSYEVRWFLEGWADGSGELRTLHDWFHEAAPFEGRGEPGVPTLTGWRTDVYLLLPGGGNMGLKWRERQLQIKGLAASHGLQVFGSQFQGYVENWVKWSFAGMPEAYRGIFENDAIHGLARVPVQKKRSVRKLRVDPLTAAVQEVSAQTFIDRGVNLELTNLVVGEARYCSLGFEAFPDDSAMIADLTRVVEGFLATLMGIPLGASNSRSYPEWLEQVGP